MHWIGSRCERFSATPSIRSVTGALPVNHIRSDGKDRLGVHGIAIRRILPQLAHERAHDPGSDLIDTIVVIAEYRKIAFNLIVDDEPGFVLNRLNLRIADCGEAVSNYRHACHAKGHGS